MERKFILPAAVALTLHAFLFFGFSKPRPPAKAPTTKPAPPTKVIEFVPWDEPADADAAGQPSAVKAPVAPPSAPDQPASTVPREAFLTPVEIFVPRSDTVPSTIPTVFSIDSAIGGREHPPVVDFSGLDDTPRAKFQPAPQYPYTLSRNGDRGEVLVEFVVDESGRVNNPHVLRTTNSEFDAATLRAVGQWRFEPGRKNGRVVRFRMSVPVKFDVTE